MTNAPLQLVRLSSTGPPSFDCGQPEQNEFLAQRALPCEQEGVSATHVAFRGDECVGYLTLAMSTVLLERHERPSASVVRALPALLVAQLAVAVSARGQQVGGWLMRFAAGIGQALRHQVGCRYLVVDCDTSLIPFYAKYGFSESKGEQRHRKAIAATETSNTGSSARRRLFKDLLAEEWLENSVAPPHLRMTELHRAAAENDLSMLNALVAAGASLELPIGRRDDGMGWGAKALHVAVARASKDAIELLLAAGAEINAIDGDCETPLHWAVRHKSTEIVLLLLARGAHHSPEGGNGCLTPLDYAVHQGSRDIADIIRNAGGQHSETLES
jgi:predicted N-acetyltransferase YhbS